MKALVLTYDEHLPIADHMIQTYQDRWQDHQFTFRVPYNDDPPNYLEDKYECDIELVESKPAINDTMMTLLQGINDEEWIYWALDDKYILELDTQTVNELRQWLVEDGGHIDGLSFVRARNLLSGVSLSGEYFTNNGEKFHRRSDYSQIWLPQFLKAKVLRYLFKKMPKPDSAKEMDELKYEVGLPDDHKLYVTDKNYAVMGESTSRGKITQNCTRSFEKYGMDIPAGFESSNEEKIIGDMRRTRNILYQYAPTRFILHHIDSIIK